jgi:uncharacterized membrane protein
MSTPQIILWTIALGVGVPSAWKNPTAGALVLAFIVSQFGLPHAFYAYPDAFTIFVIFMKKEWLRAETCPLADRFILASIPASWLVYILEGQILHFYWWYALWFIALAQFLAAGAEAAFPHIRRRIADALACPPAWPGDLLVVFGRRLA